MSFTLQIQPVGLSCPVNAGQSVLDAALADGLMLKHSCRTGTCGSCKGQVLSGEVDHADSPLAVLSEAERAQGLALFCCARARSDLVIDAPEVTELRGIGIQQMGVRVASLDKVSHDVAVLRLMLAPGTAFAYLPGQYVQVLLKDGSRRSYSMATAAARDNQLELHPAHAGRGVQRACVQCVAAQGDPAHGGAVRFVLPARQPTADGIAGQRHRLCPGAGAARATARARRQPPPGVPVLGRAAP
ncbi:2Fe-2S iron-sulfur cluster-binding protein [Pseudomonas qingdaonensis]|nr:2Fe-2S iron-sulfur cluster-binding protein [Pseudomonas qingdaonensis]